MLYLLAAVGAVTIGVVLWKLIRLGDESARYPLTQQDEPEPEPEPEQRVIGPDDDPEFLRSLDERRNRGE